MSERRISVRLSASLKLKLVEKTRRTGLGKSDIVRDALTEYFEKEDTGPSAYDIAKKMGLIGCGKSLPSDLATNKAYMEGFGRD
jgi:predicted DNA-binding protein